MKKLDIISIGSAVRDVVFHTDQLEVIDNPSHDPTKKKLLCVEYGAKVRSDKVKFYFGGGAANTSINFSGLGLRSAALTSIGDDFDGQAIKKNLEEHGVNTRLLHVSKKHRTALSFLTVDDGSGEHAAFVYYGAATDLDVSDATLKKNPAKWFYISSINMAKWKKLLTKIVGTGSDIAWNPGGQQLEAGYAGLKRFIAKTTVLILNEDEATELILSHPKENKAGTVKQMVKTIHAWGPQIVIITSGRRGSTAYNGEKVMLQKTPNDKPLDTTGAGDCYGSTFTTGYIKYNGDVEKAMKLAALNATHLVHTVGAHNGLLQWKDIPRALQR